MKQENLDLEKKIKELDLNLKSQKLSESDRHYYQTINLNYIKRSENLQEKMNNFLSTSPILLPLSHFHSFTCRCQRAIRRWCHSSSKKNKL
jgi:hypothetical protein